ncbi:MAG TPA: tyrosine-type recombinase/integrase [Actinomycetes bacterium]|nr:tyrosine-type recombinase/integrase [Actinomycetes bacterium]
MRKLKPPAVPDQPVPVIGESQLQRLLAVCAGKDFEARRDTALIMLLVDAGPRRSELVGMRLDGIDFEYDVIRVLGKGGLCQIRQVDQRRGRLQRDRGSHRSQLVNVARDGGVQVLLEARQTEHPAALSFGDHLHQPLGQLLGRGHKPLAGRK